MSIDTESGNGKNKRKLKRMKLVVGSKEVKFAVNPEDYTQVMPNRVNITQTKGGAWIDAWGSGLVDITIKGTTGVKGKSKNIDTGYARWREIRNLIRTVYASAKDGAEIKDNQLIKFFNYTDNEYWWCYPAQGGLELYRSKSKPHLYQYTIHLIGLRQVGVPKTSVGFIGNPKINTNPSSSNVTKKNSGTKKVTSGDSDDVVVIEGTSTSSKPLELILEQSEAYYTDLQPIVGGYNGKLSPVTGYSCASALKVTSSGTVSNANGFTGNELVDPIDRTLLTTEARFRPTVSLGTYNMYAQILKYSPDILSEEYSPLNMSSSLYNVINAIANSKVYDSTLFEILKDYSSRSIITKNEYNLVNVVLLDAMNLYIELFNISEQTSENITTNLSNSSLQILLNNIRALILYFECKDSIYKHELLDINYELRQIEKIVIETISNIITFL